MDKQQLSLSFGEERICKCGTKYYGLLPEVCIFCEVKKQNKIIIDFKVNSGYRNSVHSCAGCSYSFITENGSMSCNILFNEKVEIPVEAMSICNYWSDIDENAVGDSYNG